MASVLARLQGKTHQLRERQNRKIFVSSDTVQAYRVAHERKELLTRDFPLVLALADDDYSSSSTGSISMIDGSVGPDLKWTLTNINHILKTVSKFGEPTYLFANILDNDPQAFVAVTLRKGTPAEELEHLDSVLGRVSQLHIADKKPKQIPDAGDVVNAIGKGLMGILGINNKPSQQRKEEEQQKRQDEADRSAATAAQRAAGAGFGTVVNVHGRPVEDNTPLAPPKYTSSAYGHATDTTTPTRPVMGVRDKAQAEARLAALKTEMAREGAPPSAPDVKAASTDITRDRLYTPTASGPTAYPTYLPQQQQQRRSWKDEAPRPGVLSNPYSSRDEGDSSSYRTAGAGYGGYAPATAGGSDVLLNTEPYGSDRPAGGKFYPSVPHDVIEDQQPLAGYNQGTRTYAGYNAPAGHDVYGVHNPSEFSNPPKPGERGYEDYLKKLQRQAQGQGGSAAPDLTSGTGGYNRTGDYIRDHGVGDPKSTDYVSELRREADEARREWEKTQQEAADRAKAAAARDDGGWGAAGGRGQQQQRKKEAPSWLEVLGTVFAGGPAYAGAQYAPDL